jgi:hypothetical protein
LAGDKFSGALKLSYWPDRGPVVPDWYCSNDLPKVLPPGWRWCFKCRNGSVGRRPANPSISLPIDLYKLLHIRASADGLMVCRGRAVS